MSSVFLRGVGRRHFAFGSAIAVLELAVVLGLVWAACGTPASAATFTWNGGAGFMGPLDGSGTWDTSTNWWNGSPGIAWTDGNAAVFGAGAGNGAAGTVTIGNIVAPSSITFNPTGGNPYTISGGSINIINGPGGTFNIYAYQSATIASTLTGNPTGELFIGGTGTVTLSGNNTFSLTGQPIEVGPTLAVSSSANLGAAANQVYLDPGGTLSITGNTPYTSANPIFLSGPGDGPGATTINVQNSAGATLSGKITADAGASLTKTGSGVLTLAGTSTYSGGDRHQRRHAATDRRGRADAGPVAALYLQQQRGRERQRQRRPGDARERRNRRHQRRQVQQRLPQPVERRQ